MERRQQTAVDHQLSPPAGPPAFSFDFIHLCFFPSLPVCTLPSTSWTHWLESVPCAGCLFILHLDAFLFFSFFFTFPQDVFAVGDKATCSIFSESGTVGIPAGFGGRREKVLVRLMEEEEVCKEVKRGSGGMDGGGGWCAGSGRGGGMCERSGADMSGNKLKMPISL